MAVQSKKFGKYLFKWATRQHIMAVEVDRLKCIYCGGCTSVCPFNALELKDTYIEVYPKKCTDCSACVRFCPVGALSIPGKKIKE